MKNTGLVCQSDFGELTNELNQTLRGLLQITNFYTFIQTALRHPVKVDHVLEVPIATQQTILKRTKCQKKPKTDV